MSIVLPIAVERAAISSAHGKSTKNSCLLSVDLAVGHLHRSTCSRDDAETPLPVGTFYFPSQLGNSTSKLTGLHISSFLRVLHRQTSPCDKNQIVNTFLRAFQARRISAITTIPDTQSFPNPQHRKRAYGIGNRVHTRFPGSNLDIFSATHGFAPRGHACECYA